MSLRKKKLETFEFIEIHTVSTFITEAVEKFSKGGYVGGHYPSRWLELKKHLSASRERYHSATIGTVKVNAGTVAGRIMVTFLRGDSQVTVLGGEDEPDRGCGLHTLNATMEEVMGIMDEVISEWDIHAFSPNEKASIL